MIRAKFYTCLAIIFVVLASTVEMQAVRQCDVSRAKGITAGLSFGFIDYSDDEKGIVITPRIGYRFNDDWSAGVILCKSQITHDFYDYFSFGAFGRYDFVRVANERISFFVEGTGTFAIEDETGFYGGNRKNNLLEFGCTPGLSFNVCGTGLSFVLRYLFIGYNNYEHSYKHSPGCINASDFMMDFGFRRLEIGATYIF